MFVEYKKYMYYTEEFSDDQAGVGLQGRLGSFVHLSVRGPRGVLGSLQDVQIRF